MRLLKKYKNGSPIDYLLNLRIEKAKKIIEDYPGMMLKDIAAIIGIGKNIKTGKSKTKRNASNDVPQ